MANKQKIVIKLSIKNARKRTIALKAAAGIYGTTATSIDGDKIVVEGEGIDSITLTTVLRKKLGYAEMISVTPIEEKDEKRYDKSGGDKNAQPLTVHCCAAPPVTRAVMLMKLPNILSLQHPNCTLLCCTPRVTRAVMLMKLPNILSPAASCDVIQLL